MAINLDIISESKIEEEYYDEDGEIRVKYRAYEPVMQQLGFVHYKVKEFDDVGVLKTEERNEQLFW